MSNHLFIVIYILKHPNRSVTDLSSDKVLDTYFQLTICRFIMNKIQSTLIMCIPESLYILLQNTMVDVFPTHISWNSPDAISWYYLTYRIIFLSYVSCKQPDVISWSFQFKKVEVFSYYIICKYVCWHNSNHTLV